jgi:hypothetical protein
VKQAKITDRMPAKQRVLCAIGWHDYYKTWAYMSDSDSMPRYLVSFVVCDRCGHVRGNLRVHEVRP